MNIKEFFKQLRVFDGGMGQELLARGIKPISNLWSATALLKEEYHQTVIDTHIDFINAGAEDLQNIDDTYLISTAPEQLLEIRDNLEDNNYIIQSSELEMVPQTLQRLANNEINLVISLLQTLDDNDDVNKLYSNFDYFEN